MLGAGLLPTFLNGRFGAFQFLDGDNMLVSILTGSTRQASSNAQS